MDIKETKEMTAFVLHLGQAFQEAMKDGKISIIDAFKFLPALRGLKGAIEGADKIPAELKDLSEAERTELSEYIRTEFDLVDDELEAKIEMALDLALDLIKLAASFRK